MGIKNETTEEIRLNQLGWYEQVQRMEQTRTPKKLLYWVSYGRRKRAKAKLEGKNRKGCPKTRRRREWRIEKMEVITITSLFKKNSASVSIQINSKS